MTDEEKPAPLQLNDKHAAMEARMGPSGGRLVPVSYASVLDEVEAACHEAAICDISNVTRFRIRGDGALELLQRVCTHDVARQEDDTAGLTCLCNQRGGIVDCGYLYRMENRWILTGDGGNRDKTLEHVVEAAAGLDVKVDDITDKTCHFWATGPRAPEQLDTLLDRDLGALPLHAVKVESYLVTRLIASRTGYGPRWSLEVIVPNLLAGQAWQFVTKKDEASLRPIGHTARDVLRIEAGLARYGHELNETIDPFSAGLDRCVSLDHDFIGRDALDERKAKPGRRLARLELEQVSPPEAPPIPRMGAEIRDDQGRSIGTVTSGTYSPVSGGAIGLGYVAPDAEWGMEVQVRCADQWRRATLGSLGGESS